MKIGDTVREIRGDTWTGTFETSCGTIHARINFALMDLVAWERRRVA